MSVDIEEGRALIDELKRRYPSHDFVLVLQDKWARESPRVLSNLCNTQQVMAGLVRVFSAFATDTMDVRYQDNER